MNASAIIQIAHRHADPFLKWWKSSILLSIGFGTFAAGMSHGLGASVIVTNIALYLTLGLSVAVSQLVFDTVREIRDGRIMAVILTVFAWITTMLLGLAVIGQIFGPNPPYFFSKSTGLIAGS